MQALYTRLFDCEDGFTERKLEGAGGSAFKQTMVAFANSATSTRSGVLFVGVDDSGHVRGVEDPDKLQKTLRRLAEHDCYPPILVDFAVLTHEGLQVVAAEVRYSCTRPHFAGPAYVRRGSESITATEQVYRDLLLSQDDKRRYLLERMDVIWTVDVLYKVPGEVTVFDSSVKSSHEARVEEVTAFFVRMRNLNGLGFTELLQDVHISYDDKKYRPRMAVWPVGRK